MAIPEGGFPGLAGTQLEGHRRARGEYRSEDPAQPSFLKSPQLDFPSHSDRWPPLIAVSVVP